MQKTNKSSSPNDEKSNIFQSNFTNFESQFEGQISHYLKFYKLRKKIDNIFIKILMAFYNELLNISTLNINDNNNNILKLKYQKFISDNNIINNLNYITETFKNNNSFNKFNDKNFDNNQNILNFFSINNLSNFLIDISSNLYLSNVLSKKNYLTFKNIEISSNLHNIINKTLKITKNNNNKPRETKIFEGSINSNISDIKEYMNFLFSFQNNIINYNDELNKTISLIKNFNNKNNCYKGSNEYLKLLNENINIKKKDFYNFQKKLNNLIQKAKNSNIINKNFIFKFIINYLNFITSFFKLLTLFYEFNCFGS
jgi:hypothetical protein